MKLSEFLEENGAIIKGDLEELDKLHSEFFYEKLLVVSNPNGSINAEDAHGCGKNNCECGKGGCC